MKSIQRISIIGTGKAAHYFARLFHESQIEIVEIIGRSSSIAESLADQTQSIASSDFKNLRETDLILLAVKDDAIQDVVELIDPKGAIVAHCAGAVNLDVLNRFANTAVIYPLQSLSEVKQINEVPLLFEGNSEETSMAIHKLLAGLENKCKQVNSERRKTYHLAAVFANNFSNAMLDATYQLSQRHELDFELLKPLIQETFRRVIEGGVPSELQTGPAQRGDEMTIESHLKSLENDPDLKHLYQAITEFISSRFK